MDQNKTNSTDDVLSYLIYGAFFRVHLFGFFGNFISILVFVEILKDDKRKRRENFNGAIIPKYKYYWYLIFMTAQDILISILFFIKISHLDVKISHSKYTCILDFVFDCLNLFGVFMNLIVSIDRFGCIKKPIEHQIGDFLTQKYPKLISLFALILSALINIVPLVLEYPIYDKENNTCMRSNNSAVNYYIKAQFIVIVVIALSLNIFTLYFNCFNQFSLWKNRRIPQFLTNICSNSEDNTNREDPANVHELSNLSPSSQAVTRTQEFVANGTLKKDNFSLIKVIISLNIIDIFYFSAYLIHLFRGDELVEYFTYIVDIFFIIDHSANIIVYLLLYRRFTTKCFEIYNRITQKCR